MHWIEVLLEGESDVPAVREVLVRRFGLAEEAAFRLHPHRGRGRLPHDLLSPPNPRHQGLLDQLPAKLRGMSHLGDDGCVVVLLDVDNDRCEALLSELRDMLARLPKRPKHVLFRLAIEETESWFIADVDAIRHAYPELNTATVNRLRKIEPDKIVGAWERLAEALGESPQEVSGTSKRRWAERIAPHLDLDEPKSPSLRRFIAGIERQLAAGKSS